MFVSIEALCVFIKKRIDTVKERLGKESSSTVIARFVYEAFVAVSSGGTFEIPMFSRTDSIPIDIDAEKMKERPSCAYDECQNIPRSFRNIDTAL